MRLRCAPPPSVPCSIGKCNLKGAPAPPPYSRRGLEGGEGAPTRTPPPPQHHPQNSTTPAAPHLLPRRLADSTRACPDGCSCLRWRASETRNTAPNSTCDGARLDSSLLSRFSASILAHAPFRVSAEADDIRLFYISGRIIGGRLSRICVPRRPWRGAVARAAERVRGGGTRRRMGMPEARARHTKTVLRRNCQRPSGHQGEETVLRRNCPRHGVRRRG